LSGSARVFVSYRREDTRHVAGRLADRLVERFQVFMDMDTIEPGTDFTDVIRRAVNDCDVFLSVIGTQWTTVEDERGQRRLDDPNDWVVAETAAALRRNAPVIPVLVDANVSLLEQPLARGREADLQDFTSAVPIAADESALSLADVPALVGRFQVVNIKLDKCGGLTEALAMAAKARELGLKVMVGNMVGTSLAMAPGFVVGQLCDVVDLDGPIFLKRDRTPAATYADGRIWCSEDLWGGAAASQPA